MVRINMQILNLLRPDFHQDLPIIFPVDGFGNTTGSLSIYVMDGGVGCVNQFPATPGQDCLSPFPVCKTSINIANPGLRHLDHSVIFQTA
ncbi:MAG: hypothetical protein IPL22_15745 [Bacteroidetes bacterium]|nr:hypothetical protein [Bacteroidota bacterium]